MEYAGLALSLIFGTVYNVVKGMFAKNKERSGADFMLFTGISCFAAAVLMLGAFILRGCAFPDAFTVLLGIVFGVAIAVSGYYVVTANAHGSVTVTGMFINLQLFIPTLFGVIAYSQPVSVWKWLFIGALFVATYFCICPRFDKKPEAIWIVYCLIAIVFDGGVGVLQQIQQNSSSKELWPAFLLVAMLFAGISCFLLSLLMRKIEKKDFSMVNRSDVWFALITGIGYGGIHILNLLLSGILPSAVFFPAVNGGTLLLVALCEAWFFKEKLSLTQYLGIAGGLVSIVLIGMFS
ncbi:MAG: EamA family transporter [Clostridia bacterium]|nr:EamA family transporter [Clostridia bacterium]